MGILVVLTPESSLGIVILSVVTSVIAGLISLFFEEGLDVENLIKRKMILYSNYGITGSGLLNYDR